jgi:hypothetical protein
VDILPTKRPFPSSSLLIHDFKKAILQK